MAVPLRVLMVEDSADDIALLLHELRRGGYAPDHKQVETAAELAAALADAWDLVLADYRLPAFDAPAALHQVQQSGKDLPFIVVSGKIDEDAAVAIMKAGAHDYLPKDHLRRLIPSVGRVLNEVNGRRERRGAEERLRQSEERFRQLAEHIGEVFWMTDPSKQQMLYVSPAYEKIWGRRCAELYAHPATWMEAIHPQDRERVIAAAATRQVLGSYDEEYRIVRPDGTLRWIRDRAFPIADADGRVYRVTGLAQDTTARKAAEDALRQAKEFSEMLIRTANVIIIVLDRHGNIETFNEAAEKITGYCYAELRGRSWFERLVPRARYPHVWEEFQRLTAGGVPRVFENPILTKHGEERYIMWQNNQVRVDGEVIATISFGNDITERRRAEQGLQRRNTELVEINRRLEEASSQLLQSEKMAAIGQMAAGLAHEINNPVGYVSSNLDTLHRYVDRLLQVVDAYAETESLLTGNDELLGSLRWLRQTMDIDYLKEDIAALLRESKQGVTRVQQIVTDLKNFSRIDEQDWQWQNLHHGLDCTLNVVAAELKPKADVVVEYGELPPVECRLSLLNQVFMNLLINAAQAIDGRGTVWIRTGRADPMVWIEVEDTGKGIAPEHLSRIFEPFFTTKPVGKGTGLGLSLSYGIVAQHNGRIEVESTPGKGSRFRVWLPQRRQAQP